MLVRSSCVLAFLYADLAPAAFQDDGVAHSFHSLTPSMVNQGTGGLGQRPSSFV